MLVYDDKAGANAAARFWWMLRSVGHEKVQVLKGGIQAAERLGLPLDDNPMKTDSSSPYPASDWQWPLSEIDEVEAAADDRNTVIIDV